MGRVGRLHCRRPVRRKGGRGPILERAMRAQEVVVRLPPRQFLPHIVKREEDVHVQALVPQPPIETLDEAIFNWLAGPNKRQLNAVAIGPGLHGATGTFAAVVDGDRDRSATLPYHRLYGLRDLLACERLIGEQTEAFTGVLVDDRQNPKPP